VQKMLRQGGHQGQQPRHLGRRPVANRPPVRGARAGKDKTSINIVATGTTPKKQWYRDSRRKRPPQSARA
jgi:hypothetical protein